LAVGARSFAQAATDYTVAVGQPITRLSLWRLASGAGQALRAAQQREATQANAPAALGIPLSPPVALGAPITDQANVSSDGVLIRLRAEEWKEVKVGVISAVAVLSGRAAASATAADPPARQPQVHLSAHSYVAGLWDADQFGAHQYAEGLRRGVEQARTLSSVNDGAPWIERITFTNFPHAIQIVDWAHARDRLHTVAKAVWGEGARGGQRWVEARETELWEGEVGALTAALQELALPEGAGSDIVRQTPGYFVTNAARMRYGEFRAAGLPIGSGTGENAAKSVVQQRMRRAGRGWGRQTAQALLALLGEYHSGRFDWAWRERCRPAT
jgi:hypothetical protein